MLQDSNDRFDRVRLLRLRDNEDAFPVLLYNFHTLHEVSLSMNLSKIQS